MEFLVVVAAAVGLVWGGLLLVRGGLLAGAILILLAGTCFGHPFWNARLASFPITIDRLLLLVVGVQALWYWRTGRLRWRRSPGTDLLVVGFLGWLAVSTLSHDWSRENGLPLAHLVFFYAIPAALYGLTRPIRLTPAHLRWFFGVLTALGLYLAMTAIAERQGWWGLVFPSYIGSPKFAEFLGRGRGPLLNPVGCGLFQATCLAAAWAFASGRSRAGRATVLLVVTPLLLAGMYCTLTRSVWIGAALTMVVYGALNLPRAWRAPAMVGAALVGSAFVAASWSNLLAFQRDKGLTARETADSARLRPILATIAWHMFLDRPLAGCGFGQYTLVSREYLSDRSTDLPLEKGRAYVQHNTLLALLSETGAVGMGLLIALVVAWARAAWRAWSTLAAPREFRQMGLVFLSFFVAYLANAMFHDLALIAMVNALLFFLGGLTVNASLCCQVEFGGDSRICGRTFQEVQRPLGPAVPAG